jgi:hypothetical protein
MTIHCRAKPEISRLKDEQGREDGTVLNRFVTIGGVIHSDRPWRSLVLDFDQRTCRVQIEPTGRYWVDRLTRHASEARRYTLTLYLDDDPPLRHALTLAPAWAIWSPAYDLVVQRMNSVPTATVTATVDNEFVIAHGAIRSDPPFRTLSVRLAELTHRLRLGPGGCYQIAKVQRDTPAVQQLTLIIQIEEEEPLTYCVDLSVAQPDQPLLADVLVQRPRLPATPPPSSVAEQPGESTTKTTTRKRATTTTPTKAKSATAESIKTEQTKTEPTVKPRKRTKEQS